MKSEAQDFASKILNKEITGIQTSNYKDGEADGLTIILDDGTKITVGEKYIDGWCGFYLDIN